MNRPKYCVFVCTKQPSTNTPHGSCGSVGAIEIFDALQAEITDRQLTDRVEVRQSSCLNKSKFTFALLCDLRRKYV